MGCFSYLCSGCDKGIESDSFSGEHATLFVMKDGAVLEWMQGQYDSYGRVFDGLPKNGSRLWTVMDWSDICTLQFDGNCDDGIAAYHTECLPLDASPDPSVGDPNQGWGDEKDNKATVNIKIAGVAAQL